MNENINGSENNKNTENEKDSYIGIIIFLIIFMIIAVITTITFSEYSKQYINTQSGDEKNEKSSGDIQINKIEKDIKYAVEDVDGRYYGNSIAYNEIFARHGHDFQTKELREHFNGFIWYTPEYKKVVTVEELNDIERANLEIIEKEINSRKEL